MRVIRDALVGIFLVIFFAALVGFGFSLGLMLCRAAFAHDDAGWIERGGWRNASGEWCCGRADCRAVQAIHSIERPGWLIEPSNEFVPYEEAAPSPDGQLWICRRPDGSRRCTFGLKPGT